MSINVKPYVGCNMSCGYCYQDSLHGVGGKEQKMSYDKIAISKSLDQMMGSDSSSFVALHGGEPTAIPIEDLEFFIRDISRRGVVPGIQTNCWKITDEHVELFKKYGVAVGVSIDGPRKLNYGRGFFSNGKRLEEDSDKATGIVETNIQKILNAGISVGFICVLNKFNSSTQELRTEMKNWLLDWHKRGVGSVRMNLAFVDNPVTKSLLELEEKEAEEAYLDYCVFALENKDFIVEPFRSFVDNLLGLNLSDCRFAGCDPYRTQGEKVILPNGDQANCNRLVGPSGMEWLRDTNENHVRLEILKSIPQEEGGCGGCKFWKVCYGGCPAEGTGGDWRNKTRFCKAYWKSYDLVEKKLKQLMPNILLVSDFNNEDDTNQDRLDRSSGNWKHNAFDSMLKLYTETPSSFAFNSRKDIR